MASIHHATAKKAAKVGIDLTIEDDVITATDAETGEVLAEGDDAKSVLADAEAQRLADNEPDRDEPEDDVEDENGDELADDGDEPPAERSIVKRKYRKRYQPTARSCGDDMAQQLKAHLEVDGELDLDRLIRFAKANDCWVDAYNSLNNGQIRMNVGNRLRAKVRKGHEVVWAR